ncbi:MAG: hypothetical protein FJ290_02785 [Planctomycetes bacterium]|nr:hypothetical protein [Planctomycetota bacterium]
MTTRQANLAKTSRRCLKCGKLMWTDRCHRICVACSHRNEGLLDDRAHVPHELRPWLRGIAQDGGYSSAVPPLSALPTLVED